MKDKALMRRAGWLLIVGALVWAVALTIERVSDYNDSSSGWGWRADQLLFATAMTLQAAGIALLAHMHVAGSRRFARNVLWVAATGYGLSAVSQFAAQALSVDLIATVSIGALIAMTCMIIAGVIAVRRGRFSRIRRFALLGVGLTQLATTVVLGADIGGIAEAVAEPTWQAAWLLLGVASLTQPTTEAERS